MIPKLMYPKLELNRDKRIIRLRDCIMDITFNLDSEELPSLKELSEVIAFDGEDNKVFKLGSTSQLSFRDSYQFRTRYIENSFPLLIHEFFIDFKNLLDNLGIKSVIEVAAGKGWFSFWCIKYGIPVKEITDDLGWKDWHSKGKSTGIVIRKKAIETIKETEADLIILSWPPYDNPLAYNIWNTLKPNQYLLYIGEGDGGCTADEKFFQAAQIWSDQYDEWFNFLNKNFRAFWGVHDRIFLVQKKSKEIIPVEQPKKLGRKITLS